MTIDKIRFKAEAFNPIAPREYTQEGTGIKNGQKSFGDMLKDAVKEVDDLHQTAETKVADLVTGRSQSPHEAMLALEKADVAFQLMSQVRQKIIRAYEDLIRTQV